MKLLEKRKEVEEEAKEKTNKRSTRENVGEIDPRGKLFSTFASYLRTFGKHFTTTSRQFHQHFTHAFFV
jgi:hypothetical protein